MIFILKCRYRISISFQTRLLVKMICQWHKYKTNSNSNTDDKYVQQNIQTYVQFRKLPANDDKRKTTGEWVPTVSCVFKFLLPVLRCHGDDLPPLECSKARNISVIEFDNRAWLPPIQQHKCTFCLVKPHSGPLKSRRTHGMPSLQEGYEGCKQERDKEGRQSDAERVPAFLQWDTDDINTQTDRPGVLRENCPRLWWQIGHAQIEVEALWENTHARDLVC